MSAEDVKKVKEEFDAEEDAYQEIEHFLLGSYSELLAFKLVLNWEE